MGRGRGDGRECVCKEKCSLSTQAKGSLTEVCQTRSGKVFKRERAFLEPVKTHHPGSHLRAEKRLSLPGLTPAPMLDHLMPRAPFPRAQGHRQTLLPAQPARANIYIAPLRGLQQTQHRGTLLTGSRPQRGPGAAPPSCPGEPASLLPPGTGSPLAGQGTLLSLRNASSWNL